MSTLPELQPVKAKNGKPLYIVVRDSVWDAISNGAIKPGDRLPSTKALSERLDVSLVTVHRALNELVANGVLRRGQGRGTCVHENYAQPGHIATDLRFGLVFQPASTLADPYHGRVLQGVREAASERGVDLVLLRYGEDWRRECSGYLYVNPYPDQLTHPPRYGVEHSTPNGKARGEAIPLVGLGVNGRSQTSVGTVDTDNEKMMRVAVERLTGLGHRRIAYVGDASPASNSRDRERGFREACSSAGLAGEATPIVRTHGCRVSESEGGALAALLTSERRPTAVVAGGYYFALDIYAVASRAGVSIPHDLSVIGVDDPPSAAHLSPALTTFWQPLEALGRRGVELLLERIRDPEVGPGSVTLEAELRERGSTAPPAAGAKNGVGRAAAIDTAGGAS